MHNFYGMSLLQDSLSKNQNSSDIRITNNSTPGIDFKDPSKHMRRLEESRIVKNIKKYLPLSLLCLVSATLIVLPNGRAFAQLIPEEGVLGMQKKYNQNMNFIESVLNNPDPLALAQAIEFFKKQEQARKEHTKSLSFYEELGPVFFKKKGGHVTDVTPKRLVLKVAQKSTSLLAGGISTAASFATTKEAKVALNTLGAILNILALSATFAEEFVD